jgi:hypothetical protein
LVVTLAAADPPKLPLAPLPGAVNVTVTPLTALPPESFTVACKAVAKAAPSVALCGVPAVAVIPDAAPAVLVRLKFAGVAIPAALAVTV